LIDLLNSKKNVKRARRNTNTARWRLAVVTRNQNFCPQQIHIPGSQDGRRQNTNCAFLMPAHPA